MTHEPEEQYDGPASIAGTSVEVRLRGHFEPIDGRFHWWGRIAGMDFTPSAIDGVKVAVNGGTRFVVMHHPVATGVSNTYFDAVGRLIAAGPPGGTPATP